MSTKPIILILAAAAAYYAFRRLTRPGCPRQIVALGDSITAGNYIRYLGDLLPGCTVGYSGYVGKGAKYISGKVRDATRSKPDDVIILAGVNDLASGRSLSHIQDNLERTYANAKAEGARVVAVEVLPWRSYAGHGKNASRTDSLNAWIRSESSADVVVSTRAMGRDGSLPPELSGDGLHPNADGKKRLAEIIYQEVYK